MSLHMTHKCLKLSRTSLKILFSDIYIGLLCIRQLQTNFLDFSALHKIHVIISNRLLRKKQFGRGPNWLHYGCMWRDRHRVWTYLPLPRTRGIWQGQICRRGRIKQNSGCFKKKKKSFKFRCKTQVLRMRTCMPLWHPLSAKKFCLHSRNLCKWKYSSLKCYVLFLSLC